MFERFTDRARRVLVLAEHAAKQLGHARITPAHMLLGLAEEKEGVAARALGMAGVDIDGLRDRVAASEPSDPMASAADHLPFSPQAKKILELSLREALQLGHSYIGTEHLLLALCRHAATDAGVEALVAAPLAGVRRDVLQLISGARRQAISPALAAGMERAYKAAHAGQVTSGQILVALLDDERSQAAAMLASLGVDRDAVARALDATPSRGTSDDGPEPDPVVVKVGDVSVTVSDALLAASLRGARPDDVIEALRRHFTEGPEAGGRPKKRTRSPRRGT